MSGTEFQPLGERPVHRQRTRDMTFDLSPKRVLMLIHRVGISSMPNKGAIGHVEFSHQPMWRAGSSWPLRQQEHGYKTRNRWLSREIAGVGDRHKHGEGVCAQRKQDSQRRFTSRSFLDLSVLRGMVRFRPLVKGFLLCEGSILMSSVKIMCRSSCGRIKILVDESTPRVCR